MKGKLTKRTVDAVRPSDTTAFVWDIELRGFGLRTSPGGKKAYVVQYRAENGRQRRQTLGAATVLTPDQARDLARSALHEVTIGGDPAATRRALRSAPTVGKLLDAYLTDHAEMHCSPKTVAENRRLIEKRIRPILGNYKVEALDRQDIARFHLAQKDAPVSANHCIIILSKAFNLAEEWGWRKLNTNPCSKVRKFAEAPRERFLSPAEVQRLGKALAEAGASGLPWLVDEAAAKAKHLAKPENRFTKIDPDALEVIQLLLLSGSRLSEITELEWDHVDFDAGTLALPRQKGKARRPHVVSTAALAVLARRARVEGSPWVFPRARDATRSISIYVVENAWDRLRTAAGLIDCRLHDLRHTTGTWAARTGANAFQIRDVLRHSGVAMTARYANRDNDPLRDITETVGDALSSALAGKSAAVVALDERRRKGRG
ncbi:DUF4102 domain-containing protein [Siculibacillus lacustris]|uniref:DUF4102 domain-containing protein n=1 Tax=Siculibacillus lacustris TaxID=1549641 RepID=A0A4Q9VTU7_9HYPH|nr:tyrosine-type recombinase/integrase [Siculibacillus lacustris]TBW38415.1 DUF4102 domain-containing protein [Siculibacillus lacustris]